MKIAYLINQYPHVSHSFIRREIVALEAQGVKVFRFSIRRPPTALPDEADRAEQSVTRVVLDAGIPALLMAGCAVMIRSPGGFCRALSAAWRAGRKSSRGAIRHMVYLMEACWLRERLREAGVKHLHAHFGTNPAMVAMLCRMVGGPTYSFTVHGPEEFDRPEGLSLNRTIAHSSAVIAISDFGRAQLFRWSDSRDWEKIHVVHCGLDQQFLGVVDVPIPAGAKLVCVGRLCEQKGQLLLVKAAGLLARQGVDFELVLAGDGPMRGEIEALARREGIESKVRITGWVSNVVVRKTLLEGRAMVLPSFAEGLPVVIMEALALGRPVISTFVAGIPELVRDGECGWLTPAGNVEALAEAMKRCLACTTRELETLGQAGRQRVLERHDVHREAGKLIQIFRQIVDAKPCAADLANSR